MNHKSYIGKLGEDLACEYLINKGYKIIQRNYLKKWGEIDIIAKDPMNTLVFVEVKTMRQLPNDCRIAAAREAGEPRPPTSGRELSPEDNLTAAKLKKLQRTAQMFVGQFPKELDEERGWRIDLVAVLLGTQNQIEHYENI